MGYCTVQNTSLEKIVEQCTLLSIHNTGSRDQCCKEVSSIGEGEQVGSMTSAPEPELQLGWKWNLCKLYNLCQKLHNFH